jgi:GcrA cell cycle regulator
MSDWTSDRIERLKALNTEGLSAAQIARALGGVSRNAVIGKVHHLGLSPHATLPTKQHTLYPKARMAPARATKSDPAADEPPSLHVSIMDICSGLCRWPHGEPTDLENFHFCGHPTASVVDVYCSYHARRAFNPQPQKFIPYVPRRRAA